MLLSRGGPSTEPRSYGWAVKEILPWPPYSSLMIRNQYARSSVSRWKTAGYEVLEASNGRLGLALYRERSADLIITDIVMPEMSGLELMLELTRNFPTSKSSPYPAA